MNWKEWRGRWLKRNEAPFRVISDGTKNLVWFHLQRWKNVLSLGTWFKNENIDKFFEILEKALETHNFIPDRVFNVVDRGLTVVADVVCSHNHEAERVADFGWERDRVDVLAAAFAYGQFIPSWFLSLLQPLLLTSILTYAHCGNPICLELYALIPSSMSCHVCVISFLLFLPYFSPYSISACQALECE